MNLAENRKLRLFTLCVLYVAQGIPWGFMATTIPPYLGERGLSPGSIGLVLAATTLPYSFKWIWGPLIDTFTLPRFGKRRPWIVFAQLMMALTVFAMLAIPDLVRDHKLLVWMIVVHTVFNGLQDVAVDALAIDLLDDDERGRANSLMYASKYVGGIIGGAGLSWVVARASFTTALVVQVAILLAIMCVPLFVRERAAVTPERPKLGEVLRSLAVVFSIRAALVTAFLMLSLPFALGVLTANAAALFTRKVPFGLGWSAEQYTQLTGGFALAAGFGGAVVAGFLSDRFGRRRVVAHASLALATGWIVFGALPALWSSHAFAYAMSIYQTVFTAIMTVGGFVLCMEVAWSQTAASQYTAYMAMANFATTLGYSTVALVPASWTAPTLYIAMAIVQVAVTLLLVFIDPAQTRRELPLPPGTPTPARGIVAVSALGLVLAGLTAYVLRGIL